MKQIHMKQSIRYALLALCVVMLVALVACGKPATPGNESALADQMAKGLADETSGGNAAADKGASQPAAAEPAAVQPVATTPPAAQPAASGGRQQLNEVVVSEDVDLSTFPTAKTHSLQEGTRYLVQVTLDKPIQFVLYNEARYNAWKSSGEHGIAKINSNGPSGCCTASGSWQIDINRGEGGNYYFVFDATKLGGTEKPTKAHLTVTKESTI